MNLFLVRAPPGFLAVLLTAGLAHGAPFRPRPIQPGPRPAVRPQPVGNPWSIRRPQPTVFRPPVRPPVRPPQPARIPGNRLANAFHRHLHGVRPGFIVIRGRYVSEEELQAASEEGYQVVRYLVVSNQTGESLRVHVRLPDEDRARSWSFEPGEKARLLVDGEPLAVDQVRIWADSSTAHWARYKDEPAVGVPEPYPADEIGTWTVTFR